MIFPADKYIPLSERARADLAQSYYDDSDDDGIIEYTSDGVKCEIIIGRNGRYTVCIREEKGVKK